MEVPRVSPISPADGGLPAGGDRPSDGGGDLPFGPGQKLFAQVLPVPGGGPSLIAFTLPVRNGEVLAVVVRGVAMVELDLEALPIASGARACGKCREDGPDEPSPGGSIVSALA